MYDPEPSENAGQMMLVNDVLGWLTPAKSQVYCSWETGTKQYTKALFDAAQPADFPLSDAAGVEIEVQGYLAHIVPVADRATGEIKERPHLVLFGPKGESYASYSEHTLRSFAMVINSYGQGPWEPPLKLEIRKNPGKVAGHWYSLYPAELKAKAE